MCQLKPTEYKSKMDHVIALLEQVVHQGAEALRIGSENTAIANDCREAWRASVAQPAPESSRDRAILEVYGKLLEELCPPDGWEFTGELREVEANEMFCSAQASLALQNHSGGHFSGGPRLILRKKVGLTIESVYGKPMDEIALPDGWEFTGEFRTVCADEWYMPDGPAAGRKALHNGVTRSYAPRLILRKKPRHWVLTEVQPGELHDMVIFVDGNPVLVNLGR